MQSLMPTEEETLLADAARGFLDEAAPVSALRALRDAGRTWDPGLWREMAEMGWAGVLVGESEGGAGMGHAAAGVLMREMGRTLAASPFLSTAVVAATALSQAAGARARDALAGIAAGRTTYALALEEGRKHAPEATALAAEPAGNAFRLTGAKTFVADGASADRVLMLARTAGRPGETRGLTLFDLPADRPGIARDPMDMIDSRDAARLTLSGVEATGEEVVGDVDGAMAVLGPAIAAGQAAVAAEMAGLSAGAFAMTNAYLKERRQFGRPVGSFQALQHRAAHLWCEIEVTASAIAHAGRVLDAARGEVELAVSLAKARASSTARLAVAEGIQMHGGIGMTDAHDIGFFMKRARVAEEWLGDYGYHADRIARLRGF